MGSTRASRNTKHEYSGKGKKGLLKDDSDNGSIIAKMKTRKAHESKEVITKSAVKKSDKQAQQAFLNVIPKGKKVKTVSNNGRVVGRQLIRWTPSTDQLLLLIIDFECRVAGLTIPWENVAKRLAPEKGSTGACCQQRIQKLRKEMMMRGCWVPPLAGRPGAKRSTARGVVMVQDENGKLEAKDISWDEDAFQYLDRAEIARVELNHAKPAIKVKVPENTSDGEEEAPKPKRRRYRTRKSRGVESSHDEADPAELRSDDDFDPSQITKAKRSTKVSTKVGHNAQIMDSCGRESDADAESGPGDSKKENEDRKPRMMVFDDEEEEKDSLVVVLRAQHQSLADYPDGVNNTRGIKYESDAEQKDAGVHIWSRHEQLVAAIKDESDSDMSHPDSEDFEDDPTDDESDEGEVRAVVHMLDINTNSDSGSDSDEDEDDSVIPDHYLRTLDMKTDFGIEYPRLPASAMDLNPPTTPNHPATSNQLTTPNEPKKRHSNSLTRRVEETRRLGQLLSSPAYNRDAHNLVRNNIRQNAVGSQSTFRPDSMAQNHIHRHPYTSGGIASYPQYNGVGNRHRSGTSNFGNGLGTGVAMGASNNTFMSDEFDMGVPGTMGAVNNTFMNDDFEMGGTMEAGDHSSMSSYFDNQVSGYRTASNLDSNGMQDITSLAEDTAAIGTPILRGGSGRDAGNGGSRLPASGVDSAHIPDHQEIDPFDNLWDYDGFDARVNSRYHFN